MASILVDNSSNRLTASGMVDVDQADAMWFGGSAVSMVTQPGTTQTFSFSGVSVAFYGTTQLSAVDSITTPGTVSIDGGSYTIPHTQLASPWFATPTLPDGQHNVTFRGSFPFYLDYMVVTASKTTPLSGESLIAGDNDATVTYSGNWIRNTSNIIIDGVSSTPFRGGFHQTQDPMSSATFTFTGTSISVYGIRDGQLPVLSPVFTLDGKEESAPDPPSTTHMNVLWFTRDSLSPSKHTLSIHFNLPSSVSPVDRVVSYFALDFLTYTPSFSSLASPAVSSSMTSLTAKPGASSTSSINPSSASTSISVLGPSATSDVSSTSDSHMAVLIGAPVGATVGILLLACLLFLFRKKMFPGLAAAAKKRRPPTLIEPEDFPPVVPVPADASLVNPFSEPYRVIPDSHSTAPSSSGPQSVTTRTQEGSRIQLIVQGGSPDMVQIPPPEKPLSKSSSGFQYPSSVDTSARAGPSSVEVKTQGTDGMNADQAQQIQGLVNQLQQAIAAGGIVVTPESDGVSPPPYELPGKRAT